MKNNLFDPLIKVKGIGPKIEKKLQEKNFYNKIDLLLNLPSGTIDRRLFSSYLRFEVEDKPGILSNITNIFSRNKVSIKRLVQNPHKNRKSSSIIIITHKSEDRFLQKIIKEIDKKNYVVHKSKLIRIDE